MNYLYQLRSKRSYLEGDYFNVDGPHDKHGFVIRCTVMPNGEYLNVVRGTGNQIIPKSKVNEYIRNGFSLNSPSNIKHQKTMRGYNFSAIKKFVDNSNGESVKIPKNGSRGWAHHKILKNETNIIQLQKIGYNNMHPIIELSK